jgi:choline dehydrogenase-like flavoprotein
MLSGIGPKEQLVKFGIKIEHELPGVGKNLRDHTSNAIIYHGKGSSLPVKNWKLPFRTLKALIEYLVMKKGMMASNGGINVGGFIRTLPELYRPDIQYHFMGAAGPKEGFVLKPLRAPDDGFTGVLSVLHPYSVGEIRLKSANPLDAPVIDLNFYDDLRDIDAAVRGLKILRQILSGDLFNKHAISEIQPGPDVQTDDEIREFLRESVVTIYHPVGTCKMGHDNMAVVDDRLKVHGIESLRVVDASIMPTIVGGNTNAPTFMIAEKAADMILGCFTA